MQRLHPWEPFSPERIRQLIVGPVFQAERADEAWAQDGCTGMRNGSFAEVLNRTDTISGAWCWRYYLGGPGDHCVPPDGWPFGKRLPSRTSYRIRHPSESAWLMAQGDTQQTGGNRAHASECGEDEVQCGAIKPLACGAKW